MRRRVLSGHGLWAVTALAFCERAVKCEERLRPATRGSEMALFGSVATQPHNVRPKSILGKQDIREARFCTRKAR